MPSGASAKSGCSAEVERVVSDFDFDALAQLWTEDIEAALDEIVLAPGDRAYGLAFWLLYAEEGAVIFAPCVGLGTEADWIAIRRGEPVSAGFGSARWNPADWPRDMLRRARTPRIEEAYRRLGTAACGGLDPELARRRRATDAERVVWKQTWEASTRMLVHVSRTLTQRARDRAGPFARLATTEEFVALVCDPSLGPEGEALALACVDEPLASRLFPNLRAAT
jgi:hypothetical protein